MLSKACLRRVGVARWAAAGGLASTLVVEFWADPQCRVAGEFEVVIGADRLRWSCKTFT